MKIYGTDNRLILDVEVDDNSYRYRAIMGDHNLTLYFSLAEHVEIPVGAWCEYQSNRYTLERPEALKMKHRRLFEYTVTMEGQEAKAKIWMFRNPVDGRVKFPLTATPHEHLQMFVDNMNRRDSGWAIGQCIEGEDTLITYDHLKCYDALGLMAQELKTEFEIVGKTVSLRKVEYNKSNPLPLSYGKGNGFKPDLGRSNSSSNPPVEILFVQGGEKNIDPSDYGSRELRLPKSQEIGYDGEHFEDETGYNSANARHYLTDAQGLSLYRTDAILTNYAEDSLDCSEIYPKRVGTISSVVVVDADKHFYDIVDSSIPSNLNYEDYLIQGETMTIIFQSGMLAGREFDVKYFHNAVGNKAARRFEIVPAELDGETMPNSTFIPAVGDKYVVFNCMLPAAYICDNSTKSGAEWDMFREAVRFKFDNEEQKFTFTGELDGIWAKKDWVNINGHIVLGGYISFHDSSFQQKGVLVRITGIKDYVNNPHSPVIELSNETVSPNFNTEINQLQGQEILINESHTQALNFTKRRWRDAKESMSMLENALLTNFTESISPIAIQTMQLLAGDESLQYRFVNNTTNPQTVTPNITYSNTNRQLSVPAGIIQHMTLGITDVNNVHAVSDYKFWSLPAYTSAVLSDPDKSYYLYAKVMTDPNRTTDPEGNHFLLSDHAIGLEAVSGYYHLLVGLLNSEYDGERSYVSLYGFTEILPGRITTDKIVSNDGNTYFDLVNSIISGKIHFIAGSSGYNNISDRPDLSHFIKDTDGIIEIWYKSVAPTTSNAPASSWNTTALKETHIGDLYRYVSSTPVQEGDERTETTVTKWYRWEKHSTTQQVNNEDVTVIEYRWVEITDIPDWFANIIPETLPSGAQKMFSLVTPTTPYSKGDIWLNGGVFMKSSQNRGSNESFVMDDWDDAGVYDNTQTTIDGGIVTSGRVQLAGDSQHIVAGITGQGTADTSVRFWAGAAFENRNNAPFRVQQNGKMIATNADIKGTIEADNSLIRGTFRSPFAVADFYGYSTGSYNGNDNHIIDAPVNLTWDTTQSGRRLTIVGEGIFLAPPTGKYYYINGERVSTQFSFSNEVIQLIGLGTVDNFYGWLVQRLGAYKYQEGNNVAMSQGSPLHAIVMATVRKNSSNAWVISPSHFVNHHSYTGTLSHSTTGTFVVTFPRELFGLQSSSSDYYLYEELSVIATAYGANNIVSATILYKASTDKVEITFSTRRSYGNFVDSPSYGVDAKAVDCNFSFMVIKNDRWQGLNM